MKNKKMHRFLRLQALVLVLVYFVIVVSHLFFAPHFQLANQPQSIHGVHKNTKFFYYLIRNDRASTINNKTNKVSVSSQSLFSKIALNNALLLPVSLSNSNKYGSIQYLVNQQHNYLSNHVLRI